MQFIWRPFSKNLNNKAQIFTHAMMNHYSAPNGFRIDNLYNDDPVVLDVGMETFNADKKV